jgi:LysM repeat protein
MVVFWVQDIETKTVYQAGKVDAPSSISGLNDISSTNTAASIHDGSLYIHSDAPVQEVDIYTVSGQKAVSAIAVKNTVPVAHLAPGVYVVKWKTSQGEKVVKVVK